MKNFKLTHYLKFQLTPKITKALDWPEMPDGTAEWCPDVDELAAQTIEFVPNNPELNHNACIQSKRNR